MIGTLRVMAKASRAGYADQKAGFTPVSWSLGWMTRVIAQILFFSAMGLLVGGKEFVEFAFLGNVLAMAGFMALGSSDTAWERSQGTLPLLVAAPRTLLPVMAGKCAFYAVQGAVEGVLIFSLLAAFIGYPAHWWWMPVGLLVVVSSMYSLGLFLGAISIRRLHLGTFLYNMTFYTLVAIGGVNVPTSVFPVWVERTASVLPLHHGLIGTRSLLTSGASAPAFTRLGLELAVGAGWFMLALLSFRTFADKGRRDGTIDLAE
jgi:ABC-2 type transport system permease protein